MTRRLITALALALATAAALGSIGLPSGSAAAATDPTLTLTRDCETFRDDGGETIHVRLSGFPAFTPFDYTVEVLRSSEGPVHDVTDAAGNAEPTEFSGLVHHGETWTVTVVWSGGALTQSLYVDCTRPEGAITVIPPDRYPRYCTPNGVALQGHGGDDTIYGLDHDDLLRGGGGDDSLAGGFLSDCLFGQKGADSISGDSGYDYILGGRGADELNGGPGGDRIRGGRGNDTIRGSKKHDHIVDTDGRNRISCGGGRDKVVTNQRSHVAPSCEKVTRR
jgi:hypothetical protein